MIAAPPTWRPFSTIATRPLEDWLAHAVLPGLLFGLLGFALNAVRVDLGFNTSLLFGGSMAFLAYSLFGARAAIIAATIAGLWTWYAWGHHWGWVIFTVEMLAITAVARFGMTLIVADTVFWLCFGVPSAILIYGYATDMDEVSLTLVALKQALNGISNASIGYLAGLAISWLISGRQRFAGTVPMHAFLAYLFVGFAVVPALVVLCWHASERKDRVFQAAIGESVAVADTLEASVGRLQVEAAEGLQLLGAVLVPLEAPDKYSYGDNRLRSVIGLTPGILRAVELVTLRENGDVPRVLWARATHGKPAGSRYGARDAGTATYPEGAAVSPDPHRISGSFIQVSIPVVRSFGAPATLTAEFSVNRYVEAHIAEHHAGVAFQVGTSAVATLGTDDGSLWKYTRVGKYVLAWPNRRGLNAIAAWSSAHVGIVRNVNLSTTAVKIAAWKPLRDVVHVYREDLRSMIGALLGIIVVAVVLAIMIGERFSRLFMNVQATIGSLPNMRLHHRPPSPRGIAEIDSMLESIAEKNDFLIAEIEQVKRLQRRFEHLRRFAPMAIYALERLAGGEWRIVYYGPAMDRLLGIRADEIHTAERFLARVHPDHRTAVVGAWRRFTRTGSIKHEFRVRGADGTYRWVYNELSRIDEESVGGYEYAIGAVADINQRKENALRIKTSAKLITLGEMATGMAHELNQPLNVIRLASENTLARIEASGLPADLSGYLIDKLHRISDQTQRAAQIIDHMRVFGRRPAREPAPFSVNEAVDGALTLTGAQLRVAGLRLETALADGLPPVVGHQQMLEQVIINLIINARDALHERQEAEGADAGAPSFDGQVRVETARDDASGQVVVRVCDNGPGIPAEIRNRIFEPFYTTKPVGKGTGLGLSVSYGIIVEMGGKIDVSSTPKGTAFSIVLPPATPSIGAARRVPEPESVDAD